MNAVVIAVLIMIVLSLLRIHVVIALIVGGITGGLVAGFTLVETIEVFSEGLSSNVTVALSYAMLGAFAVGISYTGLPNAMVKSAIKLVGREQETHRKTMTKVLLLFSIAIIASFSQNLVPVHIAFIPIFIPPLLKVFNELNMDRRATATALTFGLKAPYILIPAGYGLIFHEIIMSNMNESGMAVDMSMVPRAMFLPVLGMLVGLIVAIFISYRKPRDYVNQELTTSEEMANTSFSRSGILVGIVAIITLLVSQVLTKSMVFGALTGLIILYVYFGYLHVTKQLRLSQSEKLLTDGMKMLAFIGFVMISAGGFAEVIRETGHVEQLVASISGWIGHNHGLAALIMLLVGLLITMGIGSSFATIPIIAAIYVPLAAAIGLSPMATIALIGTAGALGDAGSPASDSTLGPTAGLNADGQHHHIWDTCVPTFLHFNIPLIIFGWLAALIL
ncbi:Na+/H+ antiporter family protein [Salipaludibacillus agaradhaerens]|jgi:predicted histidine transporter YuiF (NhaC family)|uniref:Na+/H+ antiporter family protein n=1 Tax=Salipaludibacillus agaradhaerens TaxID=76935 RepID=UPI002151E26D|nr:Na+/H+ antiporter family protein [Salipaludibacillus agaradhaerens]MCR6107817.1 Na+/H+ antiporter family protein [Salipaludibacillus agaradhaerens]MCR6119846.1 Na+/H+ antiporter family protein [Salipaludibacillus agaradhaerens]